MATANSEPELRFTTRDLDALRTGQVLAGRASALSRMDQSDYEKDAARSCDRE